MAIDSFDANFDQSFDYVNTLVSSRLSHRQYSWLIQSNTFFFPDYFTIRTMGRGVHERLLNFLVANHWGRHSLSFKIMKRFVLLFYDVIDSDKISLDWLLNRLSNVPKSMLDWTLVEFFLFMEYWLRGILKQDQMLFVNEKQSSNKLALDLIKDFGIDQCLNRPFSDLLYLSCYANWLDVIVPEFELRQQAVIETLSDSLISNRSYQVDAAVLNQFNESQTVLYECDNCGEIIFDLLVVLALIKQGKHVVMVAKFQPILNDVTCLELTRIIESEPVFRLLKQALSDQLTIISANRFPMVGKYLPKVTPEYQHAFSNSDFVWLKGQANFQTMPRINFSVFEQKIKYKKPIGVSFIAKAPIVQYCLRYSNIKKVSLGDSLITLV